MNRGQMAVPQSILVVEPEEMLRWLLADVLGDEGYRVTTVPALPRDLQGLPSYPFALVLLDPCIFDHRLPPGPHHLPCPLPPVVLMSTQGESVAHPAGLPVVGRLPKPFDLDRLLATVAGVLPRAHRADE
jgi:DNA-binding response OmpR family regulator